MKETFYFTHDYNVRSDEKIKKLIRIHGMEGYGVFWSIVEDLYQNANALRMDCEGIAYDMRVEEKVVSSIINDFGLFIIEGDIFGSKSVETRLLERDAKSSKARDSARKRWDKNDANALRPQYECNAIKEKKEKEKKEKEKKEKETDIIVATQPNEYQISISYLKNIENEDIPEYAESYRDEWIKFCYYWSEKGKTGKIRAEGENTFEIKRRFATWMSRKKEQYQQKNIPKESALDITL